MKNFTDEKVVPAPQTAQAIANCVLELITAEAELLAAQKAVPSYTAQWEPEHYYKDQLQARHDAAARLEDALLRAVRLANFK